MALDARLAGVLKGEDRPADAAEGLEFARLCRDRGRHAAAARLWASALAGDPKLGDDRLAMLRYHAACSAALAAAGKGGDDPPPDETARDELRRQALDWLKAEHAAWAKLLESGPPQGRPVIIQTLQRWQKDPNLAGFRDTEGLAKLPEDERMAWRALWEDVASLLKRASGN